MKIAKRSSKAEKERLALFKLVELYLELGQPIGSNTLRENGMDSVSPATIRNYFASLEANGYLRQAHASGGREPTPLAYREYVQEFGKTWTLSEDDKKFFDKELLGETKEIGRYLRHTAEILSESCALPIFLSSPRFDHDFVQGLKLVTVDENRCVCVITTDFGQIYTEVLHIDRKLSMHALSRIESFFQWRLTGLQRPSLDKSEELLAERLYNEVMLRHIVSYSNFHNDDLVRTGFGKLLVYREFSNADALSSALSLFETPTELHEITQSACGCGELTCLIGDEVTAMQGSEAEAAVITIPYRINQTAVGAIGVLAPARAPYEKLFAALKYASECITRTLTKSVHTFQISYRQPQAGASDASHSYLHHAECLMIEDKSKGK